MHLIQHKKTSAHFEEPFLKNVRKKKEKKMPFFAETPILESILTILLNFFFSETKNRKVLFFCFAFNQSSSQILAIKHDYKEYFSVFFFTL